MAGFFKLVYPFKPTLLVVQSIVLVVATTAVAQGEPEKEGVGDDRIDLAALERQIQAVYEKVAPAIVRFEYGEGEWRSEYSSGVIVSEEGHIAICGPVRSVLRDDLLSLRLFDGRRVAGKALGWSGEFGVGALKIDEPGPWPHVTIRRQEPVVAGELCLALGYPWNIDTQFDDRRPALRLGAVTLAAEPIWLTTSYRIKAGHPLFDLEGRLLALNNSVPVGDDPIHASATTLVALWDDLVAGKNLDRETLNVNRAAGDDQSDEGIDDSQSPQLAGREEALEGSREMAEAASVRISEIGKDESLCSGVIVTPQGHVITCGHHNRLPGEELKVSLPDGRDARAVVLGTNLISDTGLMKITDGGPWPHVPLGRSTMLQIGDPCTLIGYPKSLPRRAPLVVPMTVIDPEGPLPSREEPYCQFWTSSSQKAGPGASGSGVFDAKWQLVGLILGGGGPAHQSEHVRIELFRKQWDLLAAGRPVDVLEGNPLGEFADAFSHLASELSQHAVQVRVDGQLQALGTIVATDGLVLTKASVPPGTISCRLSDGREVSARIERTIPELDLALLKVEADDLPAIQWSEQEDIAPGSLVAALDPNWPPKAGVAFPVSAEIAPKLGTEIRLSPKQCGGPVIDTQGRIVAVMIEAHDRQEQGEYGQSYILPAAMVRTALADE